ncbi:MAG TPA: DUF3322 domain-containing protein [Ramlibacter sp.]|nr:DUF3322 domain-containing protein [Ramlibacter sp.]
MKGWTTPAELRAQVQRLWDDGRLPASLLGEDALFPLRLTLRTPGSQDCSARFDEVRAWAQALQAAAESGFFRLDLREWRHPVLGRNALPQQAWIDDSAAALRLIGRQAAARRLLDMAEQTGAVRPELLPWLRARPLRALELADAWPRLLAVASWLRAHPRPGLYLRQLELAGVDSKFIEQHRAVLAELLDRVLPPEAIDARAIGLAGFARRYGFRDKPLRIRFRSLDAGWSPLGTGETEDLAVDGDSFCRLSPPVSRVFITENEINFLAFPAVPCSLVVFGAGYGLEMMAQVPWLPGKAVHYWGDLDTHGFAILDELRARLPGVRSLLMDEATLLAHRELWGTEPKPTQRDLPRLTAEERSVYDALRWQRLAPYAVRLEQERVGFAVVRAALAAVV